MTIEDKAGLIIAVRNYTFEKKKTRNDGTDFLVMDAAANEKVLLRSLEPQNKAGYVSVNDVKEMAKEMKRQKCERGLFISKRFTVAAYEEMALSKIQQVSDEYMPPIRLEQLYLTITNCVDNLCETICGKAFLKKSDCGSLTNGAACQVRTLSDNASYHFKQGWTNLLQSDLRQLLVLPKFPRSGNSSVKKTFAKPIAKEV